MNLTPWVPRSKAERRGMGIAAAFCATYGPLSTWGPQAAVDAFGWMLALLVAGGLSAYGGSRVSRAVNGAADPIAKSLSRWVDEKLGPPPTPGVLARSVMTPPVALWVPRPGIVDHSGPDCACSGWCSYDD